MIGRLGFKHRESVAPPPSFEDAHYVTQRKTSSTTEIIYTDGITELANSPGYVLPSDVRATEHNGKGTIILATFNGVVGSDPMVLHISSDWGQTWTTNTTDAYSDNDRLLLYYLPNHDRFVMIQRSTSTKNYKTSDDGGLTWTPRGALPYNSIYPLFTRPYGVAFSDKDNELVIGLDFWNRAFKTSDGITFTDLGNLPFARPNSVTFIKEKGKIYFTTLEGKIQTYDGGTFADVGDVGSNARSLAYSPELDRMIVPDHASFDISYSDDDGDTWTNSTATNRPWWGSLWNSSLERFIVADSIDNNSVYSSDGITFSEPTPSQFGGRYGAIASMSERYVDFKVDNDNPNVGYTINFEDFSSGEVDATAWLWDFGDGTTSTSQNPSKVYSTVGTYDVTLTVTNRFGDPSRTKSSFISVSGPIVSNDIIVVTANDVRIYDKSLTLVSTHLSGDNYTRGVVLKNGNVVLSKDNQFDIYDNSFSLISSNTIPNDSDGQWNIKDLDSDNNSNIYMLRDLASSGSASAVRSVKFDPTGQIVLKQTNIFSQMYGQCFFSDGRWALCGSTINTGSITAEAFIYQPNDVSIYNLQNLSLSRFYNISGDYDSVTDRLYFYLNHDPNGNGKYISSYYLDSSNTLIGRGMGGDSENNNRDILLGDFEEVLFVEASPGETIRYDNISFGSTWNVKNTSDGLDNQRLLKKDGTNIFCERAGVRLEKYSYSLSLLITEILPSTILDLKLVNQFWY